MSILHRVLLAFALILTIGALQSASTYLGLRSLSCELANATAVPIAQVDAAWRVSDAFQEAEAFLNRAIDGIRDEQSTSMIARFEVLSAPIAVQLKLAFGSHSDEPDKKRLLGAVHEWRSSALVLLGATPATSIPAPHLMAQRGRAIRASLQVLIAEAVTRAAVARAAIEKQARRTQVLAITCAIAAFIIGAAIAVPFALALARPLRLLQARMRSMIEGDLHAPIVGDTRVDEIGGIATALGFMRERLMERRRIEAEIARISHEQSEVVHHLGQALDTIAHGDLTACFTVDYPGYDKLKTDFNEAIDSLRAIVATVSSTTNRLFGGAEEMAEVSVDLARQSEHQAVRLQSAVVSLNKVSGSIRDGATSTREASAAVSIAYVQAAQSAAMMRDAVSAMGRIERSSTQIRKIVNVIDDIAAQTNILALNATIEASRAGDSGKGFLVVAEEVRVLARRSALAADEIKEFVGQTSRDVADGVSLIRQTGSGVDVIMEGVCNLDHLVKLVATNAEQQSASLATVVGVMIEANQMTQRNVALGERSATSVQHLHDHAAKLAALVHHLKVDGGAPLKRAA